MNRLLKLKIMFKTAQAVIIIGIFYSGMLAFSYFDRYRFYGRKFNDCSVKFIKDSYQWNICTQENSQLAIEHYGSFIKGGVIVILLSIILIIIYKLSSRLFSQKDTS